MKPPSRDFIHPVLDEEVNGISGFYVPIREGRLPYGGREVLYLLGYGEVDNSCCTEGGCGYVQVPGYILDWKSGTDGNNNPISRVETVKDRAARKELRRLIAKEEGVQETMITFE